MNNFWSIPTFWTVLALAISLISLIYTLWTNKYSIDISELSISVSRKHILIKYKITNNSSKYLKITNIKLLKDNRLINTVEFDITAYDDAERQRKALVYARKHGLKPSSYVNPFKFPDWDRFDPDKEEKYKIYKPTVPKSLPPYSDYLLKYYVSDKPDQIVIYTNKLIGLKKHKSFSTYVD